MSYTDQGLRKNPASIVSVVLVHAAIGYALYAGLAVRFTRTPPIVTHGYEVPPDAPPPPPHDLTPPPTAKTTSTVPLDPVVRVRIDEPTIAPLPPRGDIVSTVDVGPVATMPPTVDTPDLSRSPIVQGSRAAWVTEADYPPAALRAGVEGSVGIDVSINGEGRVTGCAVTQSSGDASLDAATCRVYARRARFQPALDAQGRPTSSQRADRVRWQLPRD